MTTAAPRVLTRAEAQSRSDAIEVLGVEVELDLDQGERYFGSRTVLRFRAAGGAATFVDLRPVEVHSFSLNGASLDPVALSGGRLTVVPDPGDNTLVVEATMAYSRDGQGLHRAVDPADGEAYVYGHLFLDAAPTVFACFDQPDLKAPYTVRVRAPRQWTVLGNGAASRVAPGEWSLATTRPLATYFVTVCAGPWASVRAEHDGIPLGVHARASLRAALEAHADDLLTVTRQAFDYYHRLFGIRYPFGEYHQVFVPEFNAGAMENPGCVTFRDAYLFRGAAARDELVQRANTVAHEMAHMWFGDLVTMRWWDDLWLNESFAEYMAHRTNASATEYTESWVDSTMARKLWGYAAERAPSTHPVAGSPAPDAQSALANFDGISYAKGAAVLRQLIAHVGDDAFVSGARAYLGAHAFGNGELADFIGAMEQASGLDLGEWSKGWLETSGLDVLGVDRAAGVVTRTVPAAYPADRTHVLDVAGFTEGAETFRVAVTIGTDAGALPSVPAETLGGSALVLANAADLTWATTALDARSVAALPRELALIGDAQARAVAWVALLDAVYGGTVDPRVAARAFAEAWPVEVDSSILNRVALALLGRVVACFLPPVERGPAEATLSQAAESLLERTDRGGGTSLVAARVLAQATADRGLLEAWLGGSGLPAGLEGDSDFRWLVVRSMVRHGFAGRDLVERTRAADDTMAGRLQALTAGASMPSAEAKAWAWEELFGAGGRRRSNHELNALAQGFWLAPDLDLVREYVPRYFEKVAAVAEWLGADALGRLATLAYPSRVVEPETAELSAASLARLDLARPVRRALVDADSQLREALHSRAAFDPR